MVKLTVIEFVNAMRVIKYMEEDNNQKRLNFIAKDKLLSVLRYEDKLKNINIELEKFASTFGTEIYKVQNGDNVQIHDNKLFKFDNIDILNMFNENRKSNLDISEFINDAQVLIDFREGNFITVENAFFKIRDMKKFDKYRIKLMETKLELVDARSFQRDDLLPLNELMVADILLLGPLYDGNKKTKDDNITIKIDKSDTEDTSEDQ